MSRLVSRRTSLTLLAAALGYAVLELGGRDLVGWNISLFVLAFAGAFYFARSDADDLAPSMEPWLRWAVLLIPCYVVFQMVPLPVPVLGILSPARAVLVERVSYVSRSPSFAALSIAPSTTALYLLTTAGYVVAFLLMREITWREWKHRSWMPVVPLVVIGVIEAAIGVAQAASGAPSEGTYTNKNHFAGLLEMVLPLAIAFAASHLVPDPAHRRSPTLRTLQGGLVLCAAALLAAGVVSSVSKMGYVACLGGLFVMGALALWSMTSGPTKWLAAAALVIACAFLVVFVPSDELMKSFAALFSDELTTGEGRWPIWRDTIRMISAFPVFGCGLGNYGTGFLRFQTAVVERAFDHAHNDYLELASELGLVGFLIFGAFALLIFVRAVRVARHGPDRATRILALGSIGAMVAIAIHSVADFNLYVPANALVLVCILGIAAALPVSSEPSHSREPRETFSKKLSLAAAGLLILYAPAWIVFELKYRNDPNAENIFCRFGVCDTDALIAAEVQNHGGSVRAVPVAELVTALERDPAAPNRWCDLGEALAKSGHMDQSRRCFETAVELGPYIPPVLLRASSFYFDARNYKLALQQCARVLEKTDDYDDPIFERYRLKKIPIEDVLKDGLPSAPRPAQAYLRYLIGLDEAPEAATVWPWLLSHSYVNDQLATEYVNFLFNRPAYEAAAHAWAAYLDGHRNGYLESNWIFNGDFEREPSHIPFDWRLESLDDNVDVARDSSVAHTGSYSLRVRFGGKENVNYHHSSVTAFVTPGAYRFEAFVRTQDITTDRGIAFHIFDAENSNRLDVKTEQLTGTNDWTKMEKAIQVPLNTRLLTVQIVREPSLKFDNQIGGTAWIDSVQLLRLAAGGTN